MSQYIYLIIFLFVTSCQSHDSPFQTQDSTTIDIPQTEIPFIDPLEGTEVGNGGDLIRCRKKLNNFPYPYSDGWYLLDYAEHRGGNFTYIQYDGADDYIDHLKLLVESAAPELIHSFNHYLISVPFLHLENRNDFVEIEIKREWLQKDKIIEIYDEGISFIPFNCRLAHNKSVELHQAVVRNEFVDKEGNVGLVKYSFDADLISNITAKNLQLSMLIFHEWLWDIYPDNQSRQLRATNRFFHSYSSTKMDSNALRRALFPSHIIKKRPTKR